MNMASNYWNEHVQVLAHPDVKEPLGCRHVNNVARHRYVTQATKQNGEEVALSLNYFFCLF